MKMEAETKRAERQKMSYISCTWGQATLPYAPRLPLSPFVFSFSRSLVAVLVYPLLCTFRQTYEIKVQNGSHARRGSW